MSVCTIGVRNNMDRSMYLYPLTLCFKIVEDVDGKIRMLKLRQLHINPINVAIS